MPTTTIAITFTILSTGERVDGGSARKGEESQGPQHVDMSDERRPTHASSTSSHLSLTDVGAALTWADKGGGADGDEVHALVESPTASLSGHSSSTHSVSATAGRDGRRVAPVGSSSARRGKDEDDDAFTASSDSDDGGALSAFLASEGISIDDDGVASSLGVRTHSTLTPSQAEAAPMSRHLSLRTSTLGARIARQYPRQEQQLRALGARALESVASRSAFLSRSMSARSPTSSAASSRPSSGGGGTSTPGSTHLGSLRSRFGPGLVEHFPDATHVNRRAPAFSPPRSAYAKSEFVDFDVCGPTVVTATHDGKVKVYQLPASSAASTSSYSVASSAQHSQQHGKPTDGAEKVCEIEIRAAKNGVEGSGSKEKITAIAFRCPAPSAAHQAVDTRQAMDRCVWVATKEGAIYEVDVKAMRVVDSKTTLHSEAIVLLDRVGDKMIALDEGGKISTWVAPSAPQPSSSSESRSDAEAAGSELRPGVTLQTKPSTQRIVLDKHACPLLLGDQLWICSGPHSAHHHDSKGASGAQANGSGSNGRSPTLGGATSTGLRISIYNPPFTEGRNFSATSRPVSLPRDMAASASVGPVCTGAIIPARPDLVYLGHESGHITVWSNAVCIGIQHLGRHAVVAMTGVVRFLWVGTRAGAICVYDPDTETAPNWRLLKKWNAHKEAVFKMSVDCALGADGAPLLQVGSAGEDGAVHFWDGTLQVDWLDKALLCREAEFCSFRTLHCFVLTFNLDAACPSDLDRMENDGSPAAPENATFLESLIKTATHGTPTEPPADILVFGLQELIDLQKKSLTAKTLLLGKRRFADDMGAKISSNYRHWHDALTRAVHAFAPPTTEYKCIASDSLVGLFTLVFVRSAEVGHIRDAATGVSRVGLGGRYGNKGAIATRFVVDDTSVCFINCHLSAGQRAVRRRNEDVADILEDPDVFEQTVERTDAFVPGADGSMVLDHTLCFLSGDLNYRIEGTREDTIARLEAGDLSTLLALDQLRTQMRTDPTFRLRYFTEAATPAFAPTYKYDKFSAAPGTWDSSAKQRAPAWCDRVLWREQGADWSRERMKWAPRSQSDRRSACFGSGTTSTTTVFQERQDGSLDQDGSADTTPTHAAFSSTVPDHMKPGPGSGPADGQGHVRALSYKRWEPTISDHRPVSALFAIQVRRIDPVRKAAVLSQLKGEWVDVEADMLRVVKSAWWA